MQKLLRLILASGRKRRSQTAAAAIWLLRLLRDVEHDDLLRNSDRLDSLEPGYWGASRREYTIVENEYIESEASLGFLDCAIEDLEYAY